VTGENQVGIDFSGDRQQEVVPVLPGHFFNSSAGGRCLDPDIRGTDADFEAASLGERPYEASVLGGLAASQPVVEMGDVELQRS